MLSVSEKITLGDQYSLNNLNPEALVCLIWGSLSLKTRTLQLFWEKQTNKSTKQIMFSSAELLSHPWQMAAVIV